MSVTSKPETIEKTILGFTEKHVRKDNPEINAGSTVAVHQRIVEKGKVRTQIFEGVVLKAVRQNMADAAITVRRVASGVGVERIFFINSELIEKVEVKKQAKTRRAKLYFLRERSGKAAIQKERTEKSKPKKEPKTAKKSA